MNRSLMEYRSQQAKGSDDGVVVFDVDKFREAYPSAKGTDTQLNNAFIKAGMLLRNDKHSCVCNLAEREMLLFLLVAHMDMLQSNIDEGNRAVGRHPAQAKAVCQCLLITAQQQMVRSGTRKHHTVLNTGLSQVGTGRFVHAGRCPDAGVERWLLWLKASLRKRWRSTCQALP